MTDNELYHYGVKGMKWGVRRYEKSGGSYTKAGVKRFNESSNTYDTAKSLYKTLKKNKKEKGNSFDVDVAASDGGKATIKVKDANQSIKTAKQMMKESKSKMKKDYKHLRQDKLADQGKDLYSRGYRITDNAGTKILSLASAGATATGYLYANKIIDKKQAETLGSLSAAAGAIGVGMKVVNYNKDRKLRAYYGHTSNY